MSELDKAAVATSEDTEVGRCTAAADTETYRRDCIRPEQLSVGLVQADYGYAGRVAEAQPSRQIRTREGEAVEQGKSKVGRTGFDGETGSTQR